MNSQQNRRKEIFCRFCDKNVTPVNNDPFDTIPFCPICINDLVEKTKKMPYDKKRTFRNNDK